MECLGAAAQTHAIFLFWPRINLDTDALNSTESALAGKYGRKGVRRRVTKAFVKPGDLLFRNFWDLPIGLHDNRIDLERTGEDGH
jgi:hypothetical protein